MQLTGPRTQPEPQILAGRHCGHGCVEGPGRGCGDNRRARFLQGRGQSTFRGQDDGRTHSRRLDDHHRVRLVAGGQNDGGRMGQRLQHLGFRQLPRKIEPVAEA